MSGDLLSDDNLLTAARRVVRNLRADEAHGGLLSLDTVKANEILGRWVEVETAKINRAASAPPIEGEPL